MKHHFYYGYFYKNLNTHLILFLQINDAEKMMDNIIFLYKNKYLKINQINFLKLTPQDILV